MDILASMEISLPSRLTQATAKDAYNHYKSLDNRPQDADARADFVEFSQHGQKVEVSLTPSGFLARQTEAEQITVTQASVPRWVGKSQVDFVCRTTQGAYSGFLGGVDLSPSPDDQERARKVFYQWQKPLQKPGCGG